MLPIDTVLDDIVEALAHSPAAVIAAPPGAGKTTRVPLALLRSGITKSSEIWVLQPRRIAARMACQFVAAELGEVIGETVGYQVRFEQVVGPRTRLRFVTEALLIRRLLADPDLQGIGALVFDEFHERHLASDLSLALVRALQRDRRPHLKIAVMSATLDSKPVARFLDSCQVIQSRGRAHHVAIEHLALPDDRPLSEQVANALRRLVRDGLNGDVLVFVPGVAEIHRAIRACRAIAESSDLLLLPLYGDLPVEEQDRALRPAGQRKVIVATNVAETSITIDGVVAVIDSGLARIAGHNPWSGLGTLRVRPISQASAAQRSGRAGRTREGRCLRLYTRHDHDTRRAYDIPEIARLDLSEVVITLAALGITDPGSLEWLDTPPAAALESARSLLCRLAALSPDRTLTPIGRAMVRLPVHPRQARIIVEAKRRACLADGCIIAALLGERDLRRERQPDDIGSSDLLILRDLFAEARRVRFDKHRLRTLGIRSGVAQRLQRVSRQLCEIAESCPLDGEIERATQRRDDSETGLLISILAGFPDRVARRRTGSARGEAELLLALGGSARLASASVVRDAQWLVAVDVEQRQRSGGQPLVRLASRIEPDWLIDLFPDALVEENGLQWNEQQQRVEQVSTLRYESLVLDEDRTLEVDGDAATAMLCQRAMAAGPSAFAEPAAIEQLVARLAFIRTAMPEAAIPVVGEAEVLAALQAACIGKHSFAEVRKESLVDLVRARIGYAASRALDEGAPLHITLPGGRRLRVCYELGKEPYVASHLQDFFGMDKGPTLARGRVALTLHLWAPSRRVVQVTRDLRSFWRNHYPDLRRSLSRRYPRHDWPEDPLAARPPRPSGRRR